MIIKPDNATAVNRGNVADTAQLAQQYPGASPEELAEIARQEKKKREAAMAAKYVGVTPRVLPPAKRPEVRQRGRRGKRVRVLDMDG